MAAGHCSRLGGAPPGEKTGPRSATYSYTAILAVCVALAVQTLPMAISGPLLTTDRKYSRTVYQV